MLYNLIHKIGLLIVVGFIVFYVANGHLQSSVASQIPENEVLVCLYNHCTSREVAHLSNIPRFETLEEAKQALELLSGGTIYLGPGIYRVTLEWKGNWTLKGVSIPESVVILPKQKLPFTFGERRWTSQPGPIAQIAMFTVSANSSLKIENLTLQDDYASPLASPDDRSIDEQRLDLVSQAVVTEEQSYLEINNVRVLNWNFEAIVVKDGSQAVIQNSEFVCLSDRGTGALIVFAGGIVDLTNNRFNHCAIQAIESFQTLHTSEPFELNIAENEFYKSEILAFGGNVSLNENRFIDIKTIGTFIDQYSSFFRYAAFLSGESEVIGNHFELRDLALKELASRGEDVPALIIRDAFSETTKIVKENSFVGYSVGLESRATNIELEANNFQSNSTGLLIRNPFANVVANNNLFVENALCAIEVAGRMDYLTIEGINNDFQNNEAIICPDDVPLPEGFMVE